MKKPFTNYFKKINLKANIPLLQTKKSAHSDQVHILIDGYYHKTREYLRSLQISQI